jgi:hypothetical protein
VFDFRNAAAPIVGRFRGEIVALAWPRTLRKTPAPSRRPLARLSSASMFRIRRARQRARAPFRRLAVTSIAGVLGCAAPSHPCPRVPAPAPRVECTYSADGDARTVRVDPAPDPYRVPELAAGDRFAIKFVYVTAPSDLASLRVYAFQLTDGVPVIVHEAKYLPPFGAGRDGFTGRQLVYDDDGRELAYACAWVAR